MVDVPVKLKQYQFEKGIRMLKSNLEREVYLHRYFYTEGETSLTLRTLQSGFRGGGIVAFS